ncbi:hypothetical protein CesoFtcFv8_002984 [Champsocephalus esox]|uniref:Endonuclease/exonuclease/phosphatase domain-containing protein n=1 Tax=Champsocephalus esox TaxID=159716 RepID=A0AAN8HF68_9TELE|nr:hypothetical protein CesoFtcFv8_002984 [Champsocephalus esox]
MKIAAFNVQRLGGEKVNKKDVREIIIKIVSQYSVVLLVEVRDVECRPWNCSSKTLMTMGSNRYGMLCSEPLGPEGHKEKFVYFYRENEVEIIDSYQYRGNAEDVITRQPFVVLLKCRNTVVEDLVWKNDNIVILGDFNADRPHLSMEEKETLLISLAPYRWLIGDEVNTMTRNNNHTYDRIVVYGESMLEAIVPDSAKAYNFREHLNLTEEEALTVSDHYPVELELKLEVEPEVKQMEEQMRKLDLKQKAQRKRNPE